MNIIDNKLSMSMYSGRVLMASVMLVIVMITAASLPSSVGCCNAPKVPADKPEVGMVTGVVYSPPNSRAVVGEDVVREGDAICDIAVVAIQSNAVQFSKAGMTWQQEILETPHKAWKSLAKADCSDGK